MLLAQEDVQQYINTRGIGADNTGAFKVVYNQQFVIGGGQVSPTVSQFQYGGPPGQVLPTLPVHVGEAFDFNAVVKIWIVRNYKDSLLCFTGRFKSRAKDIEN